MGQAQADSWATRAQQVLAENGHHSGQARGALLQLLDAQPCALSAIELEDALRATKRPVARASIYRILDELERLGRVQRVATGQAMVRYERVHDPEGHHHHLVCDRCGAVTPFCDERLERAIAQASDRVPLAVSEHEIVLRGHCSDCAA